MCCRIEALPLHPCHHYNKTYASINSQHVDHLWTSFRQLCSFADVQHACDKPATFTCELEADH